MRHACLPACPVLGDGPSGRQEERGRLLLHLRGDEPCGAWEEVSPSCVISGLGDRFAMRAGRLLEEAVDVQPWSRPRTAFAVRICLTWNHSSVEPVDVDLPQGNMGRAASTPVHCTASRTTRGDAVSEQRAGDVRLRCSGGDFGVIPGAP